MTNFLTDFTDFIKANVMDEDSKEAYLGFASDAEDDDEKLEVLKLWCKQYQTENGEFDKEMCAHHGQELFDFYEDYMATK